MPTPVNRLKLGTISQTSRVSIQTPFPQDADEQYGSSSDSEAGNEASQNKESSESSDDDSEDED